ncbi:MAG: TIGR00730 family Rossman fold protein [Chthoniobacteraceae bacterium]
MTRLCIYAGSSFGASPDYVETATALGAACARRGLGIVYGGGGVGLMGAVADAALAAGGEVTGVIPRAMVERGWHHSGLSKLIVVESMHERKQTMAQLGDAFVALPGGIGTLEEVCEAFTWLQLGLHAKPVGVLNLGGFYDNLLRLLDHMTTEAFLSSTHREMLTVGCEPEALLEQMMATQPTLVSKTPGLKNTKGAKK